MGRGRAKAKQQKVARELKYSSRPTDLDALQRELGANGGTADGGSFMDEADGAADDDLADSDEFDEDDWARAR